MDSKLLTCGLQADSRVLVGFSGGVDSTVLLALLWDGVRAGRLGAVAAAHLHHGIRGPEAEEDLSFCRAFCEQRGIPFFFERLDIPAMAAAEHLSTETVARRERYAFLRRTAREWQADRIAVAHHADDQAETVLMHLLRGSGTDGLAGMRPVSGDIIRPLLSLTREEIEHIAGERGLSFRRDSTNDDPAYTRNRVRLELLPTLETYNPAIRERLTSLAELCGEDADCLDAWAEEALRTCRVEDGYDVKGLSALPEAIRSRVLKKLLLSLQHGDLTRADVQKAEELLTLENGARACFRCGAEGRRYRDRLIFGPAPEPAGNRETVLKIPGETQTACGRCIAELIPVIPGEAVTFGDRWEANLDYDRLPEKPVLRPRKDGDRFYPLGAPGVRLVSDVMTDRKMSLRERQLPLLCGPEEVLWMPGYTVSERAKVTDKTAVILRIRLEQ